MHLIILQCSILVISEYNLESSNLIYNEIPAFFSVRFFSNRLPPVRTLTRNKVAKEYVASLIGLYKNNGAVSCVGINFHLIGPLYHARTQLVVVWSLMHDISKLHASLTFHEPWVYPDTDLDTIISWAIMYSNCSTFFLKYKIYPIFLVMIWGATKYSMMHWDPASNLKVSTEMKLLSHYITDLQKIWLHQYGQCSNHCLYSNLEIFQN